MKILHWAFIFVAIILPVSIICRVTVNSKYAALKDEVRINNAIDTATKDAIDQIIAVSGFDYDDEFGDVINVTPSLAQESINTFFHTLAVNYNIPFKISDTTVIEGNSSESYIKNYFAPYVPAVIVIAYDGFYVYSQELKTYRNSSNQLETGYIYELSTKIPYTCEYTLGNGRKCTVGYTLGNDIYFYYDKKCYSGKLNYNTLEDIRKEYTENYSEYEKETIPYLTDDMSIILYSMDSELRIPKELMPESGVTNFLQDYTKDENGNYVVGPFHEARRKVIIDIISKCLREEINVEHNRFASIVGATYDFYLPEISNDDWINSIDDISIMAFVQGIPIGTLDGTYFNNFALGGSRIVKKDFIYGNKVYSDYSHQDIPLYHKSNCELLKDTSGDFENYDNIFTSEEDAVAAHYLPCQLCY